MTHLGANETFSSSENEVWGMPKYEQNAQDNALVNLTDEQYLAMVLGPQRIGWSILIPITFFYVIIFISGIIGNVAVCLVIVKNKSMHTATNYYLFSLAISDLMILVLGKLKLRLNPVITNFSFFFCRFAQ